MLRQQQAILLNSDRVLWLASYPRSGNTFLRTILHHCLNIRSASIYPKDFEGVKSVEEFVGHVEYGPEMQGWLETAPFYPVKTHLQPLNGQPAIYVVRDGREAAASMLDFFRGRISLDRIISGQHLFGTWSDHIASWSPFDRPDTLLLRYEDMVNDLPRTLEAISSFLGVPIVSDRVPDRDDMAERTGGHWVRHKSDWRAVFTRENLDEFYRLNGAMMARFGYAAKPRIAFRRREGGALLAKSP